MNRQEARRSPLKLKAILVERRCLTCQRKFMSEGIGNRVCSGCKNTRKWKGGEAHYEPGGV